jgi:hypothetical protein
VAVSSRAASARPVSAKIGTARLRASSLSSSPVVAGEERQQHRDDRVVLRDGGQAIERRRDERGPMRFAAEQARGGLSHRT